MYDFDRRTARLVEKYRKDKDRKEWALLESDGPRVLKWFGTTKPSDERVLKEERRIQYFKHHSASVVMIEHAYGQWKDQSGRWAIERHRGTRESFTARDLQGDWVSDPGSLSAATDALIARAGNVSFQIQRYSYDRSGVQGEHDVPQKG